MKNKVCQVELTNYCKGGCWWCRNKSMKRSIGFMEIDLLEKICQKVEGRQDYMYLHFYGESLLYPKLIEAINIVAKYGMKPGVYTTANDLTDKMIDEIAGSKIKFICITVNRFNPREKIEKLRNACRKEIVIDIIYLNLPKTNNNYGYMNPTDLLKWSKEVEKRTEKRLPVKGASYENPDKVNGKLECSFKDKEGNCKIRRENQYPVLYDGSLLTCIKDYEGETSLGNVLDVLDKVEYKGIKCPY